MSRPCIDDCVVSVNPDLEDLGSGGVSGDDVGGIFTSTDVEKNDVLAEIPLPMILTGKTVQNEPMVKRLRSVRAC